MLRIHKPGYFLDFERCNIKGMGMEKEKRREKMKGKRKEKDQRKP